MALFPTRHGLGGTGQLPIVVAGVRGLAIAKGEAICACATTGGSRADGHGVRETGLCAVDRAWYVRRMRRNLVLGEFAARGHRVALSTVAVAVAAFGGVSALAASEAAARTIQVRENASLKLVKKSGSTYTHSGRVTGTIPGSARSRMTLDSLSISGTVTIRAKGGSLNLRINGRPRSGGLRSKFDGTATMVGGRAATPRRGGRDDSTVWSIVVPGRRPSTPAVR